MRKLLLKTSALSVVGVAAAALVVSACSPESPKLIPKPMFQKEKVKDKGDNKVTFNRNVDILFVIDDSGSMQQHQKNLSTNIQVFTQSFLANQMLDFHIGTVTSSMDSGGWGGGSCYAYGGELFGCPKFVERTTPNAMKVLERNLTPGIGGAGDEEFFSPIRAALTPPLVGGKNAGFYRSDAYLVVIFLTDSDDQSSESAQTIYDFMVKLKGGDASKVITYGVYIPTNVSSCDRSGEPEPLKLEELFRISGAKTLGLCDPDYGKKLSALGDDLVKRVGSVLYLSRPADPSTIVVTYGSQTIPNDPVRGWVYDPSRNALVFGAEIDLKPEPPGTQVEVNFIAAEY